MMNESHLARNQSIPSKGKNPLQKSFHSTLHKTTTQLIETRKETAVLQSKLPKLMQTPRYNTTNEKKTSSSSHSINYLESDAWRNALLKRLEMKNLLIAAIAEFIGTFLFLFFALAIGTRASDAGSDFPNGILTKTGGLQSQLYSSLGFGFSLW